VLINLFPTGGYWTSVEGPVFWHVPIALDPTVAAFSWYYYSKIDFLIRVPFLNLNLVAALLSTMLWLSVSF
jgi:hypothetical protein